VNSSKKSLGLFLLLLLPLVSSSSRAYTVGSGFTDACHEKFTFESYSQVSGDLPFYVITIPEDGRWDIMSLELFKELDFPSLARRDRFYLFSLFSGVRHNDTEGKTVLHLNELRTLHTDKLGQYDHFLRSTDDDYRPGDENAVALSTARILDLVEKARQYFQAPSEEQMMLVPLAVDFYGEVEVEVWAPAFYLGKALHIMQDSFSHAIRTDDQRRIVSVMNYADGISGAWLEDRDGLRHSDELDKCDNPDSPRIQATQTASDDLLAAGTQLILFGEQDLLDQVVEDWLTYEPGCQAANNYCDSELARLAQDHPTGPYVESALQCGHGPGNSRIALSVILLLFLAACSRRKRGA